MLDEPIKFENVQNPNARFDLINIQELFRRKDIDHSIETHHRCQFYILIFIEKGEGGHTIDFTDFDCKKGTVLTVRKDQVHKFIVNNKLNGHLLLFTDEFLVSYLEELEGKKTMLLFNELLGTPKLQLKKSDFEKIDQCIKRIELEYFQVNDKHSLGIIRSELHILVTQLFRIKSQIKEINYDKKYLNEFINLQDLVEEKAFETTRVQDYAQLVGLSAKTLNKVTQSIIHKTAKGFIDEICIMQIKRLLINSPLSIKEIAYQAGFEETSNFYKYFKRHTKKTPEQFREPYL